MGKVLIVEDLLDCRQLLRRMIGYGYDEETVSVEDEDSAVQELSQWTPDFIIIDECFMSKKEFVSRLRSHFSGLIIGKASKVIETSANVCDFYIFKPIDLDVFSTFLRGLKNSLRTMSNSELRLWLSTEQIKFQPMGLNDLRRPSQMEQNLQLINPSKVKSKLQVTSKKKSAPWWKFW